MLTWPHSEFYVHRPSGSPRTIARSPPASSATARGILSRWSRRLIDRAAKAVTYRSDKSEGPTAGTETVDLLEFLARVLVHIPDQGHVTTRYYGWYDNGPRGMREQVAPAAVDGPPAIVPAPRLAPTEASRR